MCVTEVGSGGEQERERELEKLQHSYAITRREVVLMPLSLATFVADIASDMFVGARYLYAGHYLYGALTLLVVVLAPVADTLGDIQENVSKPW